MRPRRRALSDKHVLHLVRIFLPDFGRTRLMSFLVTAASQPQTHQLRWLRGVVEATPGRFWCSAPKLGRHVRGCPTRVVGGRHCVPHCVPPSTTSTDFPSPTHDACLYRVLGLCLDRRWQDPNPSTAASAHRTSIHCVVSLQIAILEDDRDLLPQRYSTTAA